MMSLAPTRRGFSVPEALIGIVVLSFSGAALLTTFDMALRTGVDSMDQLQAQGLASQWMDEICRLRYHDPSQSWTQSPLGPESGESTREDFDDIDDYDGLVTAPPTDRWGIAIGSGDGAGGLRQAVLRVPNNQLDDWRTRVTVQYVQATDHTVVSSTATRFRRITVTVEKLEGGAWIAKATSRKVVAYAPSLAG